ncbi:MAG: hypothetical protein ACI854_000345 [Arenicella sp.]|jgi:hypothetical protein
MQDSDILLQISSQSHRTRNSELKAFYTELKHEVIKSVHYLMEPR